MPAVRLAGVIPGWERLAESFFLHADVLGSLAEVRPMSVLIVAFKALLKLVQLLAKLAAPMVAVLVVMVVARLV